MCGLQPKAYDTDCRASANVGNVSSLQLMSGMKHAPMCPGKYTGFPTIDEAEAYVQDQQCTETGWLAANLMAVAGCGMDLFNPLAMCHQHVVFLGSLQYNHVEHL